MENRTNPSGGFDNRKPLDGGGLDYAIAIALDDGLTSLYSEAFDYMNSKGLKGTSYVYTSSIGDGGFVTWAQLQEMDAAGWDIANHSSTHANFTSLTQGEIETELSTAESALDTQGLTRASNHVAYPFGARDADSDAAMDATGMLTGRLATGDSFDLSSPPDLKQIPTFVIDAATSLETAKLYLDAVVANGKGGVFLLHDLVAAGAAGTQWLISDFQAWIDYLVSRNYTVKTISELYEVIT